MKIMLTSFVIGSLAMPVLAVTSADVGLDVAGQVGLTTNDLRGSAVGVIRSLMGVLGILSLAIILLGGFRWMTSSGNEDNVKSAKKTIAAGIVGLAIILFAYAIVAFLFNVMGVAK
ncbi:hypothetical protein GYA54_00040 [Candidatus Kuenenbacteria bacterium]|nr:hypothetical protein [Candidatus Kuenenbacteria bacterium]